MSRETQYVHDLWHIESPTLTVANPPLELFVEFEGPSHFALPPNCPVSTGLRPSWAVGGASNRGSGTAASRRVAAFGRVGGSQWSGEDPLVAQWHEIGIPLLSKK